MLILLYTLSLICIVATVLPLHESKHWFVRGQANFKAAYFVLNIVLLFAVLVWGGSLWLKIIFSILLVTAAGVCWRIISPYTIFSAQSIIDHEGYADTTLSILTFNVYQYNEEYEKLLDLVSHEDPDILLLLETNLRWDVATSNLQMKYGTVVKEIREDTYGIIMMSRIDINEARINHLVSEGIPSAEMLLDIEGKKIRILGIHPEPPIPGEVKTSLPKEKEILSSAQYFQDQAKDELQILVGDLNDVAWSGVSKRFISKTNLGDPRQGRGFYSTFPTYSPLRMPLDHVFCSKGFTLLDFRVLRNIGSDHYPVFVKLALP